MGRRKKRSLFIHLSPSLIFDSIVLKCKFVKKDHKEGENKNPGDA